jgi:superfamily I DNA and RNA helicase
MSSESLEVWLSNLDPAQRMAAESSPEEPLLISAGAGSGKTRVIMTRIAWLVDRIGVDPKHILALSFTRKACQVDLCLMFLYLLDDAEFLKKIHQFLI